MGKKEKVETVEKKVEEKVVPEVPKSKPVEQPKAPAEVSNGMGKGAPAYIDG